MRRRYEPVLDAQWFAVDQVLGQTSYQNAYGIVIHGSNVGQVILDNAGRHHPHLPAINEKPFTTLPAYLVTRPTTSPPNACHMVVVESIRHIHTYINGLVDTVDIVGVHS